MWGGGGGTRDKPCNVDIPKQVGQHLRIAHEYISAHSRVIRVMFREFIIKVRSHFMHCVGGKNARSGKLCVDYYNWKVSCAFLRTRKL